MFDLRHLGHGVGQVDDLRRAAAAGQDDVNVLGAILQGVQHVVERQPAVDQRVGDLVEHDHEVLAPQDGGFGDFPAVPSQLAGAFEVLAFPAEAVTQPFDGQPQLLEHAVLAKTGAGHLHELENPHFFAMHMGAAKRAQRQPEGSRAFAFAVARVDDDQPAPLALRFVVGFLGGWGFNLHGVSFQDWE